MPRRHSHAISGLPQWPTYGPYTLEDLQRYVASGHVLPTDLAKSTEMPDWLPVSQVLSSSGLRRSPPQPPTLAPLPTYPAVAYPDPPNLNWALVLLFGLFTCGLFFIIWDLVIAAWAKRVQPSSQGFYYIVATVLVVLNFGSSYGVSIGISQHHAGHRRMAGILIGIIAWVVRLVARFSLRDTFESTSTARSRRPAAERRHDLLLRRTLLPVQTQWD